MSVRSLVIQVHVLTSCGVVLCWLGALAARVAPWRRHHVLVGRIFMALVVASSASAVGLASAARDAFGAVFMLQPLVLCVSAGAHIRRSRRLVRVLGCAGLLVAAGVLVGFAHLLAARRLIDVVAFAWAALTLAVLAFGDVRAIEQPAWRAHGARMLAVGWFYVAELGIFVFDPHPSVVSWLIAGVVPALGLWLMRRRPSPLMAVAREPATKRAHAVST